jgi:hypothetical protein
VGELVLVEDGHLVAGGQGGPGDGGPDAAGAHDQDEHWRDATGRGRLLRPLGGGEDDLAARLGQDVLRDVPDEEVVGARAPAEQRAAPDPGRLLRREDDRLHAAPPRLLDDRLPGPAGADGRGGDLDAVVLLPHGLRPPQRRAGALELRLGQPGVDRQRHRHLEDPQGLDRRRRGGPVGLVEALVGGEPPGRLDDVVVERAPVSGTSSEPYSKPGAVRSRWSADCGTRTRRVSDLSCVVR